MKLFPSRTVEERQSDRKDALSVFFVFVVLALAGLALFFLGGGLPPAGHSLWVTARWIALIVGFAAAWLAVQSLFELAIAWTIGPERAFALLAVVVLIGALFAWWA